MTLYASSGPISFLKTEEGQAVRDYLLESLARDVFADHIEYPFMTQDYPENGARIARTVLAICEQSEGRFQPTDFPPSGVFRIIHAIAPVALGIQQSRQLNRIPSKPPRYS